MRDHEPFFPTGTVLIGRVDANLVFEEMGGNRVTGERGKVVAGIVVGHGGDSRRRGGGGREG